MNPLQNLFNPKSIAVIGASKKKTKIGYAILNNIKNSGYQGNIYPINNKEKDILGYPCYKRVSDIKGNLEVAIIVVPENIVLDVATQCGEKKVKFLVVISAGFKEIGKEGQKKEQDLINICKHYKMRLIGPNVVGITDTHTPLNASFLPGMPTKGKIAFISQSGAMLLAIFDWSETKELGFSKLISIGNKADLNEIDFIEASINDPHTKVVLCYLEDILNGQAFIEILNKYAFKKPIIIMKAGISDAGAKAASSHTGALAGSDVAYDTAFNQYGAIRVHKIDELFDLATTFINQPLPNGNKIAVITNSGGPGIIAIDNIEKYKLAIANFKKETIKKLKALLPKASNIMNPVDLLGDSDSNRYQQALKIILEDDNTDALLIILSPTAVINPLQVAHLINDLRNKYQSKPIITVFIGGKEIINANCYLNQVGIPCFTFPEPAIKALAGLTHYASIKTKLNQKQKTVTIKKSNQKKVAEILNRVKENERQALLGSEGAELLTAYGINSLPTFLVTNKNQAVNQAQKLGYPVVLKIASPYIIHKTDIGGIEIKLNNQKEVLNAYQRIINRTKHFTKEKNYGIEVQKMINHGHEVFIGMKRDPNFGPLLAFGLGGIYVNLLNDVSFRLAQHLTINQIEDMIKKTKAYSLLKGYRGDKASNINNLITMIAHIAKLAIDFPEIKEIDLNPVIVYANSAIAIDIKIIIDNNSKI